jgi:hypothetical protein
MGNSVLKERSDLLLKLGENYHKKEFLQKNISLNSTNSTLISTEQNSILSQSNNQSNKIKTYSILLIKYRKQGYERLFSFFISSHILISHLSQTILNNYQNIENIYLKYGSQIIQIPINKIAIKNNIIAIYFENRNFEFFFGVNQLSKNELKTKNLYCFEKNKNLKEINFINISLDNPLNNLFIGSPIFYKDSSENIVVGIINEKGEYKIFNTNDYEIILNYYYTLNDICQNGIEKIKTQQIDFSFDNFIEYQIRFIIKDLITFTHINLSGTNFNNNNNDLLNKLANIKFNFLLSLNLSNNNIGDSGLEIFSKFKMPLLDELFLDNNNITKIGINTLFNTDLLYQLLSLSLNNNIEIKDNGIYYFKNSKNNLKLKLQKLKISNINITDLAIEYIINNIPSIIRIEAFDNFILDVEEKNCIKKNKVLQISKIKQNCLLKSLYFEKNVISEILIKNANLFISSFVSPESFPYKILNSNIELIDSNCLNNINNIYSKEFLVEKNKNDYLYNCVQNLYVKFQGEPNEYIYSCFVINSNSIITFSEELKEKVKKEKKNLSIRLTSSFPEIIKKYSLYIKKNYIQICFQNYSFREWFGIKKNINFKKQLIFSLTTDLESNLSKNQLFQINIEEETKFNPNFNLNEFNKFNIGCSICIKDVNDDIYSIGLIQSNMKKYYFTKNDIESLKYNILLNKLLAFEFNIFDVEKNIIELRLNKCGINDEDINNLSSMELKKLTILTLSNNNFTYKGCYFLSQMNLKKLLILDISYNKIGESGLYFLSRANCEILDELDLSNSYITNNSIIYLLRAEFISNISRLNLQDNILFNKDGLKIMVQSNLLQNLKYLFLNGTSVGKINLIEICQNKIITPII